MQIEHDLATIEVQHDVAYMPKLKKPVTIRMGEDVIGYFKSLSEDTGIPYQSLINFYLRDCMNQHRKPDLSWA